MEKPIFRNAFRYASFVWLGGAIAAPFLYMLFDAIIENEPMNRGVMALIVLIILYGGVFSIPCWVLLILATHLVNQLTVEMQVKKILLFGIASVLTYILFFFLFGREIYLGQYVSLAVSYWISVTFGVFYFSLNRAEKPEVTYDGPLDQL